jgi:Xaa-Pro aminopeptidase
MSVASQNAGIGARTDRLLELLEESRIDSLLVTDLIDVRYLTGYTGSNGLAFVGRDRRIFVTDARYVEQAAAEVDPSYDRVESAPGTIDLSAALPELLGRREMTVGFDDDHTSVASWKHLSALFGAGVTLLPAGGLIRRLRRTKDEEEIALISQSQAIADEAFGALLSTPIIGRTEADLAIELELAMRRRGASGTSFPSIVASGAHGSVIHAQPRDVAVEAGQLVTFDWGAVFHGYASDCTRTVATGEIPGRAREAFELVLRAQETALAGVLVGADAHAVDAIARDIITDGGYGQHFGHGLGHGVGLDVHEAPTLSVRVPEGADSLKPADVVTVEPGVYVPGEFGIRIEDLVVVREAGPQVLTGVPKALRVVE